MLHNTEWIVSNPRLPNLKADLHFLFVLATMVTLLLAVLVHYRPVTALSGANHYIYDECPTGARVVVYDWGDNIFMVSELVGDKRYTIGYYSLRTEALATASRTCNN